MRHGKKVNHLGRTAPHRKAMLSNMAASLIKNKRIVTTVAKAKALRVYVEPLITKSKEDNTHNRRTVFAYLRDKDAIKELFGVVSEKVASRPGGYTRILKMGNRMGDNAEIAMIELVDFNDFFQGFSKEKSTAKKTTRRSRSKAKSEASPADSTEDSAEG
jgi:large subunit ribosomal protein L17